MSSVVGMNAPADRPSMRGFATEVESSMVMDKVNQKRAWISMFAVVAMMSACGGGGDEPAPAPPPVVGGEVTPSPPPPPPPPPAPPPGPVPPATVSGTVSVLDISLVDSDTNDPLQTPRAANGTLATAQPAANPAAVLGYVNKPGEGPEGPNKTAGDELDLYRVDLVAGQVVELNFGDAEAADVDLYILDTAGNPLGESIGLTRSECVRITRSGTFIVAVNGYEGASNYELAWGPPRPGSTCANATTSAAAGASGFVPHELIAKPRADDTPSGTAKGAAPSYLKATALLDGIGIARKAGSSAGEAMLIGWPDAGDGASKVKAGLAAMRAPAGASLMKAARSAAPPDASDAARRAFDTIAAAKQLAKSGAFEYVELNTFKHVSQAAPVGYGAWPPNDEWLSRQPHYGLIELPAAFDALASLSPRPTYVPIVGVVDSGIVADHPELQRMLVPGYDFISSTSISGDGDGLDANPNDEAGSGETFHGTHVAGTIAAESFNSIGVIGVAPMARIMPVRALSSGVGGTTFDILQGVRWAAGLSNSSGTLPARRADVINLSLGGSRPCSSAEAEVYAAVRQQGVIVVAATGNDAAPVGSPANCANVIAVSAVSYDRRLASYSNSGPETAVAAPGGDQSRNSPAGPDLIYSTHAAFSGGARRATAHGLQGTSMATPHVAGVMALMRAVNPSLTPAQVDTLLASGALTQDLGTPGRDASFGYGLIDALKAVQAAAGSGTTPTPVPDLPTIAVTPTSLDFGTTQTELGITVTRINGSSDTPTRFSTSAIDPAAVTVAVPSGTTNPPAGPFRFVVRVDRARLAPGENAMRVDIISTQNQRVSLDVSVAARTTAPVGQLGVGPVYVLAVDVATVEPVRQAAVATVGLTYAYSIPDVVTPQIVVVAGTDTDNDGFICSASEPCGLYPVLGGQPTVLDMAAGSVSGINFDLVSGGASAASTMTIGNAAVSMPARGFRRVMP